VGGGRFLVLLYAALAVVGAALPLAAFLPWLATNGFDVWRFVVDLFANRVSSFFALDVIVSALVLTVFVIVQGRRDRVAMRWLPIAATFLIGVSCWLPLFLCLREVSINRPRPPAA
jgi:hypothetical protein